MATTFAVVAVFIPVAFMGGIIGKIFFQFGVTVTFAVLVSLFVSFTLDPMLSSVWADPEVEHARERRRRAPGGAAHARRTRSVASPSRSTTGSSASPTAIRAGSAGRSATGCIVLAVAASHDRRQLPHPPAARLHLDARRQRRRVHRELPDSARLDARVHAWSKRPRDRQLPPEAAGDGLHLPLGRRRLPRHAEPGPGLRRAQARAASATLADIQNDLRGKLRQIPGVRPQIQGQRSIFGGFRQPIQVSVQGPEASRLKIVADRALAGDPQRCPAWRSPTRARRATSRSSTCASTVRRPGAPASASAPWRHAPAAVQRPARDHVGGSAGLLARRGRRLPRFAAHLGGRRVGAARSPAPSSAQNGLPSMVPLSQVADVRAGVGPAADRAAPARAAGHPLRRRAARASPWATSPTASRRPSTRSACRPATTPCSAATCRASRRPRATCSRRSCSPSSSST